MIQVTMAQLVAMSELLRRLSNHRFPAGKQATAYQLNKLQRAVTAELKYFQDQRRQLIEEYGQSRNATREELVGGAESTVWEVLPTTPSWPMFLSRLNELLNVRVELPCQQFNLNMFDTIELSVQDISILEPFLVEEKSEIAEDVRN